MIPKVFYVGVIVAVSQLTGVFTSSFLSLSNNHEILAIWANAESIIIAITSLLFFGHQHSLNRDLIECNSLNKKTELIRNTQNIIFSMSIFFFIFFILFSFIGHEPTYIWIAIIAILIGLSPDFSLYGISKPIHAGAISFLRIGIPNLTLLYLAYLDSKNITILFSGVVFSYFIATLAVLTFTKLGMRIPTFDPHKLKEYFFVYKLGLPSLLLTSIRTAPIIVATSFFSSSEVVPLILFNKYFLLGIGIKRLFVQTYYKNILNKLGALKLDAICLALASISIGTMFIFSDEIMPLIGFENNIGIYNACLALVFMNFLGVCNGTRVILLKKDELYFFIHIISVLFMTIIIFFAIEKNSVLFTLYAGIVAEVLLALGMLLGRIHHETNAGNQQ